MPGVDAVEVDLERKVVAVRGDAPADDAVRAAIDEAGYDVRRGRARSVTLGAPARLAVFCAGLALVGGVAALAGAANRAPARRSAATPTTAMHDEPPRRRPGERARVERRAATRSRRRRRRCRAGDRRVPLPHPRPDGRARRTTSTSTAACACT